MGASGDIQGKYEYVIVHIQRRMYPNNYNHDWKKKQKGSGSSGSSSKKSPVVKAPTTKAPVQKAPVHKAPVIQVPVHPVKSKLV